MCPESFLTFQLRPWRPASMWRERRCLTTLPPVVRTVTLMSAGRVSRKETALRPPVRVGRRTARESAREPSVAFVVNTRLIWLVLPLESPAETSQRHFPSRRLLLHCLFHLPGAPAP